MSTTGRRAEFFALEANEYLADLTPLAAAPDAPDAERLVRGARALRGAALMAGLGTYARAAAGLEAIARQVREHAIAWQPHARDAWTDGLVTLRGLLNRAPSWEAADDRQALVLAERLERVAHGRMDEPPRPAPPALTPGVRAFIARESALIAGSLEEAARALAPIPPPAALAAVLQRMQSLRGIGTAAELSPLPELLDAMEVTTRSLLANVTVPPDVAAVFTDAAHALATMARTIGDSGRIVPPAELERIAARLLQSFVAAAEIVPIEALAPGAPEPAAPRGGVPSTLYPEPADGADDAVPVELVGVGDHLLLVADALANPASPAARDLRLFVLYRTLATMPARTGTGRFLAPLARAITAAIASGTAAARSEGFVAMLRDAGHFLVDAGSAEDRAAVARQRDQLAAAFAPHITPGPATEALPIVPIEQLVIGGPSAPRDEALPVVPIETLLSEPDAELPIVAIEELSPADELDIVPIEALAFDAPPIPEIAPGEATVLERAFVRRREVVDQRGAEEPALATLIGAEIVAIETLLYRGRAALERADEIRTEILRMLEQATVSLPGLHPYITELLDLVPLARDVA